jgi:hypothetical protein
MKVIATLAQDIGFWLLGWAARHGVGHAVLTRHAPDGTELSRKEYGIASDRSAW